MAPLTKMILTLAVSVWALLIDNIYGLLALAAGEIIIISFSEKAKTAYKALSGLFTVALMLVFLQYVLSSGIHSSIASGLKMFVMSSIFVFLLTTTRLQDITVALVNQCRVPYEYAFMLTTALRFVPDFLVESQSVREAQACRGYVYKGNPLKRLLSYAAIIEPLVLRAVSRSETMAMSLELRGFGNKTKRQFITDVSLRSKDYIFLAGVIAITAAIMIYC